jgi:hypothetical protein
MGKTARIVFLGNARSGVREREFDGIWGFLRVWVGGVIFFRMSEQTGRFFSQGNYSGRREQGMALVFERAVVNSQECCLRYEPVLSYLFAPPQHNAPEC